MEELKEREFCKEIIHEFVDKIEELWILEQILRFINNITKEGI